LHFLQHVKSHRVIKTSVFQTNLGRNIENISCANRQVVKSSAKTGQDIREYLPEGMCPQSTFKCKQHFIKSE